MPIGPYFADFACLAKKLVIELDGGQHAEAVVQDAARTRVMGARGYRVIRFWNNDVLTNTEGVLECIADHLSTSPSHSYAAGPSLSNGSGTVEPAQ
jgi:very-short-patch-repair endonuclease